MKRLWLHVRAPFAAYRGLQAGVYRTTMPTMPPSAAYGLVLNLAAIETRDSRPTPTTLMRTDLPCLRIAVGDVRRATPSTLYQQLHSYPVGNAGKPLQARTHGAKHWIAPIKREILVDLEVVIGVETEDLSIVDRIEQGLHGSLDRYGLPFAGDNNLMFDDIRISPEPVEAYWYCAIGPDDSPLARACRLTAAIDRADNSRTTSVLCAPSADKLREPPEKAWSWVPRAP